VPPIAVACISSLGTLTSVLSVKFNLRGKKDKLERKIQKLNKIKDRLDYIVSCNGDLTEEECNLEFYNNDVASEGSCKQNILYFGFINK